MKRIFALFSLLIAPAAHAASGGPDPYGYTWVNSDSGAPYQWVAPDFAATTVLSGNAVNAGNVTLDVPWGGIYGEPVSEIRISRNGYITDLLTANGNDETNDCPLPASPSVGAGGWRIYPLHDNLEISDPGGTIKYQYYGQSPHPLHGCGVHVITWEDVYHSGNPSDTFSFQALLFDNLDILFQYGAGNPENGGGSTTGIQNAAASIGLNIVCNEKKIGDEFAIIVQPPELLVNTFEDQNDSPAGAQRSLREAVRDVADGGRVVFSSALNNQTCDISATAGGAGTQINLTDKVVAIDASNFAGTFHLSGGDEEMHFNLNSGAWLGLSNLYLERGHFGSVQVRTDCTLVACDTDWIENDATLSTGGAINLLNTGASAGFTGCDFLGNAATSHGGAINALSGNLLRLERCRLWNNHAMGTLSRGGAIYARNIDLAARHCEFAMNIADLLGGGVNIDGGVDAEFYGCTFDNNRAGSGAAVALTGTFSTATSDADFRYSTFFENCAAVRGGAFFEGSFGPDLELDLINCTLYKNDAGSAGGAFYFLSTGVDTVVQAIIMADNGDDQIAGLSTLTNDLDNIETGNEASFSTFGGQSNITDIGLSDLGHFGGFVRVCMPLQASPAADTAFGSGGGFLGDARGFPNIRTGPTGFLASDVGAVELGPTVSVTNSNATGAGSLQDALNTVENGGVVAIEVDRLENLPAAGLTVPAGKTVFVDASPTGRCAAHNFSAELSSGQSLALHAIEFTADAPALGFETDTGHFTTHDCEFIGYSLAEGEPLLQLDGPASIVDTTFCDVSFLNTHSVQSTSVLIARGSAWDGVVFGERGGTQARTVLSLQSSISCVQGCSFTGNNIMQTSSGGSGMVLASTNIDNGPRSWLLAENNTFSGNRITRIGNGSSSSGCLVVAPRTFGAIEHHHAYVAAHHNTIVNTLSRTGVGALNLNSSSQGFISAVVSGNILAGNSDNELISPFNMSFVSGGGNLADDSVSSFTGSDFPNTDPLLGPLVLGKGGTYVHVPLPGSPCIDALTADSASARGCTDGRGFARYYDADGDSSDQLDIGAVESGRVLTVTTASDENDAALGSGTGDSLRECVAQISNFDALNIGFAAALAGDTITLGSSIAPTEGLVDVQGGGQNVTLTGSTSLFVPEGDARLNVTGLTLGSITTGVFGTDRSRTCFSSCLFNEIARSCRAQDQATTALVGCEVTGSNASLPSIGAFGEGRALVSGCTFHGESNEALVKSDTDARVIVKGSTLAKNETRTCYADDSSRVFFLRCTASRNGRGFFAVDSDARIYFHRSIVGNNATEIENVAATRYRSLGDNLLSTALNYVTDQPGDLGNRSMFLAPLADYDGDGLTEMPPLAASAAFGENWGAAWPPTEIITVTTTADEDDNPPGSEISLREAIDEIEPGGTIIFEAALNNGVFDFAGTPGIVFNQTHTIDATSLPLGIDLTSRLAWTDGHRLALHGIHIRDVLTTISGGAIRCIGSDGTLIASHCAFSENDASRGGGIYIQNGTLHLENCTFSENSATDTATGGAIHMPSTDGTIEFCTIADNAPAVGAITGNANTEITLYASVIFDQTTSFGSALTLNSQGFNMFRDTPIGASPDDDTGNNVLSLRHASFADNGGWVDSFLTFGSFASPQDFLPPATVLTVPPPEHDTRGFLRVAGSSADSGAYESGGDTEDSDGDTLPDWWELLHGLDPFTADDLCSDTDGDGTNLEGEYAWLLDPNDPALLQDISLTPDPAAPQVSFQTQPGYSYRLERSTNLTFWTLDQTFTATGTTGSLTAPVVGERLFWRLRID